MTAYKHWTTSAIECYKRGGVCRGCYYNEYFFAGRFKCQMKSAVISLVQNVGLPPQTESSGAYESDDDDF